MRLRGVLLTTIAMVAVAGGPWQPAEAETAHADPPPQFRIFGRTQGLPSNEISDIGEDAAGNLWIATGAGLARYDGLQIEKWPLPGLPGQSIDTLLIDREDRIWLGLTDAGLALLDAERRLLRRWHLGNTPGWPANENWALVQDHRDHLLIGTFGAGIIDLEPETGEFSVHPIAEGVSVINLLQDPDENIWIGSWKHGLFHWSREGEVTAVARTSMHDRTASDLAWFNRALWLSLHDGDVCSVQGIHAELVCEDRTSLPSASGSVTILTPSRDQSELWAGHRRGGLSRRTKSGIWTHISTMPSSLGSLPTAGVSALRTDSQGGLWIGTVGGGMALLSPLARSSQAWIGSRDLADIPTSQVVAISATSDRIVAASGIGTDLLRLDRGSGQIGRIVNVQGGRTAFGVRQTHDGIWVAGDGGLTLWADDASRHWPLSDFGAEIGGVLDHLLETPEHGLLIGIQGHGLFQLPDPGSRPRELPVDQRPPTVVEQLLLADERLWVASEQGLHHYDGDCRCLQWWPGVTERVHSLARAPDGQWWLALAGRVHVHGPGEVPGPLLREIDWPHAPPGGIAVDAEGRLWLAGPAGLAILELEAERPRMLAESLGPIAYELSEQPFETAADGYWFGSKLGILHIDPTQLPPAPLPRRLLVDDISVRRSGKTLTLDASMPATLKATDSDLRIQVRAPLPLDASALHLRSRIEGWDDDWRDLSDGERIIGTLPAGQYRLLLEAWHPADVNHRLTREWTFEVLPPWWRTGPALLLWLTLLTLVLWLWQRLHDRRLQVAHALEVQRQKAEWAQDSAESTSRFLAHLSHEIRNPLSGLLGLLRIAESESDEPKQQQRLALVRSAGQQIAALVEDVLVHARREPLPLRLEALKLQTLAGEAADRHRPQAQARGIEIRLSGPAQTMVLADRTRLLQILDNLLGNALKFTERGQIQIGWDSGEHLLLWIQDDGPGIPAGRRETIFAERGQLQVDGRGLGLGLSIARQLAQAMGGELALADPLPGLRGARFVLTLPAATSAETIRALPRERRAADRGQRRWLLVEDDPVQRASLQHELAAAGMQIEAVGNALTALPLLQADPALGLLTDLGLPEIDGLTLVRMLRAQDGAHRRPILVLTGRALPDEQTEALAAGADRVLSKPIEPEALLQALGEWGTQAPRA